MIVLNKQKKNNCLLREEVSIAKRKLLGQFFTPIKVARLLTLLSTIKTKPESIIDPMCGSGNILRAAKSVFPLSSISGIEVDPIHYEECLRDGFTSVINDNAFDVRAISSLSKTSYDLVITNPPYVRYQSYSSRKQRILNSLEIRESLNHISESLLHLDCDSRQIFQTIINKYSGLSDLALPAWILCMMLTKVDGKIAMVVPESWLTRDYALPIQYLLLKLFEIEYVIEDGNRFRFDNAQIKTTLVIAKRVQKRNIFKNEYNYLKVFIPNQLEDSKSIIGRLFPDDLDPDISFCKLVSDNLSLKDNFNTQGIQFEHCNSLNEASRLLKLVVEKEWFQQCEMASNSDLLLNQKKVDNSPLYSIPQNLFDLFQIKPNINFESLQSCGATIGQGLRTGANSFFYVDIIDEYENDCLVFFKKPFNQQVLVPKEILMPTLRKQNELDGSYSLDGSNIKSRLLYLYNFVIPGDLIIKNEVFKTNFNYIPEQLCDFIRFVEKKNIGSDENPKYIPELSAVRTNVSKPTSANNFTSRFWYMLPRLQKRHRAEIIIPRINHNHPKSYINLSKELVVDANFSTINFDKSGKLNKFSAVAILNSSFLNILMEYYGSVMGGGALKLEAAHLKKLPFPDFNVHELKSLEKLGKQLSKEKANYHQILKSIDGLIWSSITEGISIEEINQIAFAVKNQFKVKRT